MQLSNRESEILTKCLSSSSRKMVAVDLGITPSRVYNAISRVRAKRDEAIRFLRSVKPFRTVLRHRKAIIPDRELTEEELDEQAGLEPTPAPSKAHLHMTVHKKRSKRRRKKQKRKRRR